MIAIELAPGHIRYLAPESLECPQPYRDRNEVLDIRPYLREPRTIDEIADYFDLTGGTARRYAAALVKSGAARLNVLKGRVYSYQMIAN